MKNIEPVKKEWFHKGYNQLLVRIEKSLAHSKFCFNVYGQDLCQVNMLDIQQLQDLTMNVLNLKSMDVVVDLGCGVGRITEHIAKKTQAYLIGIDSSNLAIQRALERIKGKKLPIDFQVGDMNNLSFKSASIDVLITIDVLYIADNIKSTIRQIKRGLKRNGKIAIFHSEYADSDNHIISTNPENSLISQTLEENSFHLQTFDYTQSEKIIRQKQVSVLNDLK